MSWKRTTSIGWVVAWLAGAIGTLSADSNPGSASGNDQASAGRSRVFRWLDSAGEPVQFDDEGAALEFLREAQVVGSKKIGSGIAGARKVLLRKDGLELSACFRSLHQDLRKARMEDGRVLSHFRDDALFEVAAYRLSRLLGLESIPPTVPRRIDGRDGSLQLWVEGAFSEADRLARDLQPPSGLEYMRQVYDMRAFDRLILNEDRHLGNILVDSEWKIWMIDHTRSFRRLRELVRPERIRGISRVFWGRLQGLDELRLRQALDGALKPEEFEALTIRLDLLLKQIRMMIAQSGEHRVLFSFKEPGDSAKPR